MCMLLDGKVEDTQLGAFLMLLRHKEESAEEMAGFAEAVEKAVERQLKTLPRADVAGASWADFGAVITVASMDEAPALVDAIAPEHLELAVEDPEALFARIRNVGAVFLGRHTPEAIGDYVGQHFSFSQE